MTGASAGCRSRSIMNCELGSYLIVDASADPHAVTLIDKPLLLHIEYIMIEKDDRIIMPCIEHLYLINAS
jgi:hypothetical protein